MPKNPCYNCKDRTAECHATCEPYLAWSKKRREKNQDYWKHNFDADSVTMIRGMKIKDEAMKKRYKK